MPEYSDPAQRLEDLIDAQDGRIAHVFRTAVAQLKDELDLDALADLLQQGRVTEALDQIIYIAERLGQASQLAFITSGQSTADFLTGAGVGRVVFDQVNIAAVAAMQANRLTLIREFTEEQRRATSFALISGVESGINPIAQARTFRDSVGLTERQWRDVATYRASLEGVGRSETRATAALTHALRDKRSDGAVRRAIRQNKPLDPAKIEDMVQKKIKKAIAHRAEVIGRTEALRAAHEGNEAMYAQAIANGTLNAQDLERKWVTRLDGRERVTHELLNGVTQGWGGAWETRNGSIRYPGDPMAPAVETIQCRCAIATRIKRP